MRAPLTEAKPKPVQVSSGIVDCPTDDFKAGIRNSGNSRKGATPRPSRKSLAAGGIMGQFLKDTPQIFLDWVLSCKKGRSNSGLGFGRKRASALECPGARGTHRTNRTDG